MINANNFSVSPIEKNNKKWMRRIIIAKNNLSLNQVISSKDLLYLRKNTLKKGISASETEKVLGKRVKKPIIRLEPIFWDNLE